MDYKKAIMKLEQQEVEDLDLDQQEQLHQDIVLQKSNQCKYMVIITVSILAFLILLVFFGITIADYVSPLPKVHIDFYQQAYFPDQKTSISRTKSTSRPENRYSFDELVRQVKISQPSPINLVQIQRINSAHRRYQKTLRQMQASNSHMVLDQYKNERISKDSSLTYSNYLLALDSLQLTTFAMDDFSIEYNKISNQQRIYYSQKYWSNQQQNQICVVLTLTQEGLQSQQYYLAIKSILQQQYYNYKLIVLNHPSVGMLEEVEKLLRQFNSNKITFIDYAETSKEKVKIGNSFYIRGIVNKYCKETKLTLLLHDRGELIGKQVFKTINKVYAKNQPSIIFTHYLLEPINPLRSTAQTFRYKVPLYPPNLSNSRNEAYKTKYLKVYSTQMLLKSDEWVMKRTDGSWIEGLFQSNLQFSILELSCRKYYLLQEIMYMTTKHNIENAFQVLDARMHDQLKCYLETQQNQPTVPTIDSSSQPKLLVNPFNTSSTITYLQQNSIKNLTQEQIAKLKQRFAQIHFKRAKFNDKIYNGKDKQVNIKMIDLDTKETNISKQQLQKAAKKLMNGARASLYIDDIKDKAYELQQKSNKPQPKDMLTSVQSSKPNVAEQSNSFVIFFITDNNNNDQLSLIYTIQSVITQKYFNFKLIIIDNKSNDGTAEIIKYHLSIIPQNQRQLIEFLQTSQKAGQSQILYQVINKYANNNQIVIVLDNGQQLIHSQVLSMLNQHYIKTNALAVYSNSLYIQNQIIKIGISIPPPKKIIQEKAFRKHPPYIHKLITFRNILFSKISKNQLISEKGQNYNQPLSYALEQLACENVAYLNDILVRLPTKPLPPKILNKTQTKYSCLKVQQSQLKNSP